MDRRPREKRQHQGPDVGFSPQRKLAEVQIVPMLTGGCRGTGRGWSEIALAALTWTFSEALFK
ncbi:hypothetical protein EYF80_027058 [Liparis tanakae]|uniref:Uncharacterized protein n=1 Tax=Liparis tanakae TaxID=230148 RepID=A0A4Z2HAD1_9TELE|nr:hypothetical protein EYF80_027058 [Liparis tanakae]